MGSRKQAGSNASGRFVVRLDPALHEALRRGAARAGVSLNDYCAGALAAAGGGVSALEGAAEVVLRAARQFGPALAGVIAHGSWVRGEAVDGSDLDALIVVDRSVTLTRALYRAWDAAPILFGGHQVDPHIVQLPHAERPPTAFWAEVAVDGIVLFERALDVSRELIRVRRAIADGKLVRHISHGQPYWTEVA